jgi:hypothetical protein
MRNHHRAIRSLITLASVAALPLALLPGPATATTPAGAHQVNRASPTTMRDRIHVLNGSPHDVVFATQQRGVSGAVIDRSERAFVLRPSGHVASLGRVPFLEDGYEVVGDTVTASNLYGPDFDKEVVTWWNVATGKSGKIKLPAHESYRGTAPGGFFFVANKSLHEETTAGVVKSFPTPLQATSEDIVSSTKGAVFSAKGAAAYVDYSTGKVTHLHTGTHYYLSCGLPVAQHVACYAEHPRGDNGPLTGLDLLSLTGGKPQFVKLHTFDAPTISKAGMSWIAGHHLTTLSFSGHRTTGSATVDQPAAGASSPAAVSAFGQTILTRDSGATMSETVGANRPFHRLRTAPKSPVAVSRYAVGGNRLAWRDDAGSGSRPEVHLADIAGGVVSHERTIADTPGLDAVAVSADVLAYGTKKHGVTGLEISAKSGHSTFVPGVRDPVVQAAGTRVLYLARKPKVLHAYVYNTATGTTEKVGPALFEREDIGGTFTYFATAALGGRFVTYQQKDGSIWTENLDTSAVTKDAPKVDPAPVDGEDLEPTVFAYGDWAGWPRATLDVATHGSVLPVAGPADNVNFIAALTSAGVVYSHGLRNSPYHLAPYGTAGGPTILSGPSVKPPLTTGNNIVWSNEDDTLYAAAR